MLFVREFKRGCAIALYLAGKPQVAIVRALLHLNVNKSFVSYTITRYRDTGNVVLRLKSTKKNGNITRNDPKSEVQI